MLFCHTANKMTADSRVMRLTQGYVIVLDKIGALCLVALGDTRSRLFLVINHVVEALTTRKSLNLTRVITIRKSCSLPFFCH